MNLRVFPYYTIDHPLNRDEKLIISNRNEIGKTRNKVYEISKSQNTDRVRLVRIHISGERENRESDTKRIKDYEKSCFEKEKLDYKRAKINEIFRFTRSLIIAYLLYMAPDTFWSPIVTLFNMIAHGLSDYARWCIIAFFPLKAIIRSFGTLIYIKTPGRFINIGIPGRWQQIHENAKTLNIYEKLDVSVKEELIKEIDVLIKNMKGKDNNKNKLIDRINALLINILENKDLDFVNSQLNDCIKEGEKGKLWGEMVKLNMLRKEILFFLSSGECNFSTIHQFYPESEKKNKLLIPMADIKFQSFSSQSLKLKEFNSLPLVIRLKTTIFDNKDLLLKVNNQKDRIRLLEKISIAFERMRDEAGRYHMGQNQFIPNEKGNDISLFYHHLYQLFGATLCDLENKYRRANIGFIPIISEKAQKKRISKLFNDLEIFLYGHHSRKWKNKWNRVKLIGGKNMGLGLATSFLILFLTGSMLGIFIVNPGDKVIRSDLKIGYMGKFFNKETTVIEAGNFLPLPFSEKEIAWHLPQPLSRHSIISSEKKELSIYMIMGEHHTDNPLKKLLYSLSGQLGTKFDVIELKLKYIPHDAEKWSLYNIDGKGERRLIRDLSELTEEWRNQRDPELTTFTNSDFEQFFRELSDDGIIEEYLRRSFSQTTFSTNIYYGSLTERFDSGIKAVISEFEKTILETEQNSLIDIKEKELLKENIQMATQIVKDLQKNINEQVTVEYNQLRRNPEILNQLVKDPYNNIQRLKDFETLWINISNYIQHLYRQKHIMEILSSGTIIMSLKEETGNLHPEQMELAEFLQDNSLIIELIEIQSIKFNQKIIGLTEFTQYQEKWKETI